MVHKILVISAVYWFTLEGMLIFTSLFDRYCFITLIILHSLRTLYVYAEIIPLKKLLTFTGKFPSFDPEIISNHRVFLGSKTVMRPIICCGYLQSSRSVQCQLVGCHG